MIYTLNAVSWFSSEMYIFMALEDCRPRMVLFCLSVCLSPDNFNPYSTKLNNLILRPLEVVSRNRNSQVPSG